MINKHGLKINGIKAACSATRAAGVGLYNLHVYLYYSTATGDIITYTRGASFAGIISADNLQFIARYIRPATMQEIADDIAEKISGRI